jgi:hypothetical protein
MASTYSDKLRLELMTTGEKSGSWGTITNTNLGTLLEEAVCGYVSVTHNDAATYTLTTNDGSSDEARNMVLNIAGALTAARNVVCPTKEKLYVVKNATTGGYKLTFKTSGGTGVDIPNGYTMLVYCDGTNVVAATTVLQSTFRLVDSTDVTKQILFDVSGVTTATTRTITFPDSNTTLVGTTNTQTLTNKTLTEPTLTLKQASGPTPTAEGDIQWDTNDDLLVVGDGAAQKIFVPTASFSGDATVSTAGAVTIANDAVTTSKILNAAVTYAKIQDVSATSRALGRKTGGAGDVEELTLSELLDFIGSAAQGDILYRGAASWARLGAGTSGQYLKTQGAGANPIWADVASGGLTYLGAITTTSGASASLGTLTLTGYTFVELWFNAVSHSGATTDWLIGNSTSDDVIFASNISGSPSESAYVKIDLSTGIGFTVINGAVEAFDSALSTASTTISIAPQGTSWDAGSVRVYGIS